MKKITENDVSGTTYRMNEYGNFAVARAFQYVIDSDKSDRLKALRCKYCFYMRNGMAGQACTEWVCRCCGSKEMWGDTATPMICNKCAKKHSLCTDCSGDQHGRTRRKATLLEGDPNQPTPDQESG